MLFRRNPTSREGGRNVRAPTSPTTGHGVYFGSRPRAHSDAPSDLSHGPRSPALSSVQGASYSTTETIDVPLSFVDVWPPLPAMPVLQDPPEPPPPRLSPSSSPPPQTSASSTCEVERHGGQSAVRSRAARKLVKVGFYIAFFAFFFIAVTNYNCTYWHRKGALCVRPGLASPYNTPVAERLRRTQPSVVKFSDLRLNDAAQGKAAQALRDELPNRQYERLVVDALHARLSRTWKELLDAAREEDAALSRVTSDGGKAAAAAEKGGDLAGGRADRQGEPLEKGDGEHDGAATPPPVERRVPRYLRYLATLHAPCDPAGNHYDLPGPAGVNATRAASTEQPRRPPRVVAATVSNQVDLNLCTLHASASLIGLPFVTLGMGQAYSGPGRYETLLEFIDSEGMQDEDVVIYVDSDTTFTGEDVVPFLEKFIRLSPATEGALDPALTRAWEDYGEILAPSFAERELGRSHYATTGDGGGGGDEGGAHAKGCPGGDFDAVPGQPLLQMPPLIYNAERNVFLGDLFPIGDEGTIAYALSDAAVAAARNREPYYTIYQGKKDAVPSWLAERIDFVDKGEKVAKGAQNGGRPSSRVKGSNVLVDPTGARPLRFTARESLVETLDSRNRYGSPWYNASGLTADEHTSSLLNHSSTRGVSDASVVFPKTRSTNQDGGAATPGPRSARRDPFFYHPNPNNRFSTPRYLNSGAAVMRVWAYRRLVMAMREYRVTHQHRVWDAHREAKKEDPEGYAAVAALGQRRPLIEFIAKRSEERKHNPSYRPSKFPTWLSDQSIVAPLYLLGRIWEADHGVLFAKDRPRATVMIPELGIPAGLQGLDRRSEFFFVATNTVHGEDYVYAPDYRARICGVADARLCKAYPPRVSRAGAVMTQPLFVVLPTQEEVARLMYFLPTSVPSSDARKASEDGREVEEVNGLWPEPYSHDPRVDAVYTGWRGHPYGALTALRGNGGGGAVAASALVEVARPVLFHYAGGWKELHYTMYRSSFPWYAAARSGNVTAFRTAGALLDRAVAEVWGKDGIYAVPLTPLCGHPFPLH